MDKNQLYVQIGSALFSIGTAAFDKILDFARQNGADTETLSDLSAKYRVLTDTIARRAAGDPAWKPPTD